MKIFNPDGSEPERCGNGVRCCVRFIVELLNLQSTHGRDLNLRVDNFENPYETMFFVVTGVAGKIQSSGLTAQQMQLGSSFLKNVHPGMKTAATILFGSPNSCHARPNTFGDLCE